MYNRPMESLTKKKMFLTWLLFNVLSCLLLISLYLGGYADGVGGAPVYAMAAIFAIGGLASAYAGRLSWRADDCMENGRKRTDRLAIIHDAQHIFYAVAICQLIGLTGALMGYKQESAAAGLDDAAASIKLLTLGLGNGLSATLFGVIVSVLLWGQHHLLVHPLEKPNP